MKGWRPASRRSAQSGKQVRPQAHREAQPRPQPGKRVSMIEEPAPAGGARYKTLKAQIFNDISSNIG